MTIGELFELARAKQRVAENARRNSVDDWDRGFYAGEAAMASQFMNLFRELIEEGAE